MQFFAWINLVDLLINNYVTWVMPTSLIAQGAHFVPDVQLAVNYNLWFGHVVTQAIYNANVLNFGQVSLTRTFLNLITNPMTTLAAWASLIPAASQRTANSPFFDPFATVQIPTFGIPVIQDLVNVNDWLLVVQFDEVISPIPSPLLDVDFFATCAWFFGLFGITI
jgi:hypothetical protein